MPFATGIAQPGKQAVNWNPFKKKQQEPELDPLRDLMLSGLKPGYVLDYDLKTWQVTAQHYYDFEGDRVDEWELSCPDGVLYLEREDDDGVSWTLSSKIPLSEIDDDLRGHMRDHEDPPDTLTCRGVEYEGESSAVGQYFKNGEPPGQEFIVWEYLDASGKRTLTVEQWGDDEFEASLGEIVEEYQFSNILPS